MESVYYVVLFVEFWTFVHSDGGGNPFFSILVEETEALKVKKFA